MTLLALTNLSKRFGGHPALTDIDLNLDAGSILCLLGPSGCGKTTLLRLVAGLERPDRGRVIFDGKDVTDLPPHRRRFGFMFQEFALFPHKSVFDNVAFGPQMLNQSTAQVRRRTQAMLSLVGMADFAERSVDALSGGERQRVALARSLAPQPRLLMLDEPLGALDRGLRERLLVDIRSILKDLGMTAIFVTHDQSEALAVADQIAVMHRGTIEQIAPPETLYMQPKSLFVARFLGFHNLLAGCIAPGGGVETQLGIWYPLQVTGRIGDAVSLIIRPEGATLATAGTDANQTAIVQGKVITRYFSGQSYRVRVGVKAGVELVFDLPNAHPPPLAGKTIELHLDPSNMVVINPESAALLAG